jgi:CubicO group peptidase (beta-lactamase class C family)
MAWKNCLNWPRTTLNTFFRIAFFLLLCFSLSQKSEARKKIVLKSRFSGKMAVLDARMQQFIRSRDFPGAVLWVRKGNKTLIRHQWGETHYGSHKMPNPEKSVYDLASVTKAIAVSITIMALCEQGRISPNDTLGKWIPATKGFPLGRLTVDRLLAHKTGLPPYYYPNYWLISKDMWNERSFSPVATALFPDPYRGIFMPKGYRQKMLRDLCQLPFQGKSKTIYSDLNYVLWGIFIEEISGKRLDVYLDEWLFRPMGLKSIGFNPLLKGIAKENIVPTGENPNLWGWVHDNEAAKLAGICGAAGLFSNAADLVALADMLRQGGTYQGKRYLKLSTIRSFAWEVEPGHARARGWQKPAFGRSVKTIAPPKASRSAFGHTGYTGTLFWVDPKKDISVIFLTNVTYPRDGISHFKKNAGYKTVLKLVYDIL